MRFGRNVCKRVMSTLAVNSMNDNCNMFQSVTIQSVSVDFKAQRSVLTIEANNVAGEVIFSLCEDALSGDGDGFLPPPTPR